MARSVPLLFTAGALAVSMTPAVAHASDLSYASCQYIVTGRSGNMTTGQLIGVFIAPYGAGSDITGTCDIKDGNGTVFYHDSRKSDPDVGVWFFGRQLNIPYGPASICTSQSWSYNPALTLDHRTGTVDEDWGCTTITT